MINNLQENQYYISNNRFDRYIIILILSLSMGDVYSPLLLSRVLAVFLFPKLFRYIGKCEYTKNIKNFFVFFITFCVLSLVWTFNFTEGCKTIVYNCIHFALFLEIIVFSRFANNPLKSISTGWTLAVLVLSLIALWEIITGNHLSVAREADQSINLGGVISQRMMATATFGNFNKFVTFLCYALPWIFYRMVVTYKDKVKFIVTVVTLVLAILTIFINGSRGGLFAVVIIIGIYIFCMPKGKASYITSVLFIGTLLFMMIKYGEQIFLVLSMRNEGQGLASDSGRIEIWTICLRALTNSFGLGSGIGGINGAIEAISKNVINVPHNMIIEALLEYGFIFGVIFIVFIFKLLIRGYRICDKNRRMAVLMAMIALPLFGIINSLYLKNPETFALFATIFVFTYYERIKFYLDEQLQRY